MRDDKNIEEKGWWYDSLHEMMVNLHHKMYALATDYSLFPMDVHWHNQKQENVDDAMKDIRVWLLF